MNTMLLEVPRYFDVIRFWKDGTLLLGTSDLTGREWNGTLCIFQDAWKAPDMKHCTASLRTDSGVCDVATLSKSMDGNRAALIGFDSGGMGMYELALTESEEYSLVTSALSSEHDDAVVSVSLAANNSNKAVSGSYDRSIKIWDLESFTASSTYTGAHWNLIFKVKCHPESPDILASCGMDGRVVMWDTRQPRPATVINRSPGDASPTAITWHPNYSSKIVIGDESGTLVGTDVRNRERVLSIGTNERMISEMEFSSFGENNLAVCAEEPKVSVINVGEDHLDVVYSDEDLHTDFVRGAAWHPISNKLYTCGWDKQIVAHNVSVAINGSM